MPNATYFASSILIDTMQTFHHQRNFLANIARCVDEADKPRSARMRCHIEREVEMLVAKRKATGRYDVHRIGGDVARFDLLTV